MLITTPVIKPTSEMAASPFRAHIMSAKAEPTHKIAAKLHSFMSLLPSLSQVKLQLIILSPVKSSFVAFECNQDV